MEEFLKDFSDKKITLKYYLVKPNYSKRQRTTFAILFAVFGLGIIGISLKALSSMNSGVIVTIFFILFLTLLFVGYFADKYISNYNRIGKIFFHEEHLHIQKGSENVKLDYKDIIKIEYAGSILKFATRAGRIYYSYNVKFYTAIKRFKTYEIERELFLDSDESKHFRKIHPTIERTIKEVKPKYGITEET